MSRDSGVTVWPRATYRVQLREEFDFEAATVLVPYLEHLGVSHLYCSPYMQAAPHSPHGYDVVDPTKLSRDLGGERGLRVLDAALRDAHIGQMLDIVPNHMCISDAGDRWWWDVLRTGRDSPFAPMFDIDWDAPALSGRVLLPVLGDPLVEVLSRGELRVVEEADGFELDYLGSRFPLAHGTAVASGPATLHLLEMQHFILEDWKTAGGLINYRRFFDVSSLAGVRVEVPAVFSAVLSRALELVDHGIVAALRIDHIDGLHDPAAFAQRLRAEAPAAWIVAEKILAMDERLPATWPLDGTTGYEFGALLTTFFVHPPGLEELTSCYQEFTGDELDFAAHSHRARLDVLATLLSAELGRLTRAAAAAGVPDAGIELAELLSGMPVYRLYPSPREPLTTADESALEIATERARSSDRCAPERLAALVATLRGVAAQDSAVDAFRARFQQVAGAVMAKGVEDTAFYRALRLVALNEVGNDPERITTMQGLHDACHTTARDHPLTLLATATHDTKRGEDARLRVALLSEMPALWRSAVVRLHEIARAHRGPEGPSAAAEYLLYQTLVAAHPLDADRCCAYMLKAAREGKQETSWLAPDEHYEAELERFVREMAGDPEVESEISALVGAMTPGWQHLSLSQTLLKLTAPGVPDIYQGCELWDLRLVDPDNRTPVDYDLRASLLDWIVDNPHEPFMSRLDEGVPKLRLFATALGLRGRYPDAFGPGSGYEPLSVRGAGTDHAVCFARTYAEGEPATLTVAFRWPLVLGAGWGDTVVELPPGSWRNALTGEAAGGGEQALDTLLAMAPIALLERA
jgi:(1->4)-alpha-D-glucan 1-alpha-D-glucosylmutase